MNGVSSTWLAAYLRSALVSVCGVVTVVALQGGAPESLLAAAPAPSIHLNCDIPHNSIVSCGLAGRNFRPRESLEVTYRLTFTSLPKVHGVLQHSVYRRHGSTDARGSFTRPALRFAVVRYHESYRLNAVVVGKTGDRASVNMVAIAQ